MKEQDIETTVIDGDELTPVRGTYIPAEPEVRYYRDGSGHPGMPESVDNLEALVGGKWDECPEHLVVRAFRAIIENAMEGGAE